MSESESEFSGLLRHKCTVDVCFYLFTVGFQKCRIIYGRINETPLYMHYISDGEKCIYLMINLTTCTTNCNQQTCKQTTCFDVLTILKAAIMSDSLTAI